MVVLIVIIVDNGQHTIFLIAVKNMKINLEKYGFIVNAQRLNFAGWLIIITAFIFMCLDLTKPRIKSKSDLTFINGALDGYTWSSYGKGSTLSFKLQKLTTSFQVKADFYSILQQEKMNNLKFNDSLTVGILNPANHAPDENYRFIYSITTPTDTLLNYQAVIEKHNSHSMKVMALIFALFGIATIYWGYKKRAMR